MTTRPPTEIIPPSAKRPCRLSPNDDEETGGGSGGGEQTTRDGPVVPAVTPSSCSSSSCIIRTADHQQDVDGGLAGTAPAPTTAIDVSHFLNKILSLDCPRDEAIAGLVNLGAWLRLRNLQVCIHCVTYAAVQRVLDFITVNRGDDVYVARAAQVLQYCTLDLNDDDDSNKLVKRMRLRIANNIQVLLDATTEHSARTNQPKDGPVESLWRSMANVLASSDAIKCLNVDHMAKVIVAALQSLDYLPVDDTATAFTILGSICHVTYSLANKEDLTKDEKGKVMATRPLSGLIKALKVVHGGSWFGIEGFMVLILKIFCNVLSLAIGFVDSVFMKRMYHQDVVPICIRAMRAHRSSVDLHEAVCKTLRLVMPKMDARNLRTSGLISALALFVEARAVGDSDKNEAYAIIKELLSC